MSKNKLGDLNNHLFEQLERLNDEELTEEQLNIEIGRSKAITNIAQTIINNATLALNAKKYIDEFGDSKNAMPEMLELKEK